MQRRSKRNIALQGASANNFDRISSRRQSLDKAASRRSLENGNSHEAEGLANEHQKPEGTTINPIADVERGQTHMHDSKRGD